MKKILFIHQNFPGQFRHISTYLARTGKAQVWAIGHQAAPGLPDVELTRYTLHREPTAGIHHYVSGYERAVLYGQAVVKRLQQLAQPPRGTGFFPDVVVAHPGWGESLFVKELFPQARLIHFCEYYYHAQGADADFDPEFALDFDRRARICARNALHLLNLELCDLGVTPTQWQKQLHPSAYRHKIHLAHEGIDTQRARPDPQAHFTLPDGSTVCAGDEVVTYVARNLEPYRGFHIFMRTLPALLQRRPRARVLIVGGDEVSYGHPPNGASCWRERLLDEIAAPLGAARERVHFLGRLPYAQYLKVLQVSAAHVYLTYPFVLSWSMLEAMACGCLVVGSATAPVEEVLAHERNGLLVPFFDSERLVATLDDALAHPSRYAPLREAARENVCERYNLQRGLRAYLDLIGVD